MYMCLPRKILPLEMRSNHCGCVRLLTRAWLISMLLLPLRGMPSLAQTFPDPFILGKVMLQREKYDSAVVYLSQSLPVRQEDQRVYLHRAEAWQMLGNSNMALADLLKAEELQPGSASFRLARLYALSGQDSMALRFLREHLGCVCREPRRVIMSEPAFRKLERTRQWVNLWKEEWYTELENLVAETEYLINTGRYTQAWDALQQGMAQGMDSPQLFVLRARLNRHFSNPRAAERDYQEAVRKAQPGSPLHRELGLFYFEAKRYQEARRELNRAYSLDPSEISILPERAGVMAAMNDFTSALRDLELYLSYDPGNTEVISQAGKLCLQAGQSLKALEYFNRSLAIDRSRPELFIRRGDAYLATRTYRYAVEDYSQALDLDPQNGKVYLNRGIARLALNDREGACYDWKKAVQYGERSAQVYLEQHCR